MNVRSASAAGGLIEIRLDKVDGPVLAEVEIGKGSEWRVVNAKLNFIPTGVHDLVVTQGTNTSIDLDWVGFVPLRVIERDGVRACHVAELKFPVTIEVDGLPKIGGRQRSHRTGDDREENEDTFRAVARGRHWLRETRLAGM